MTEEDEGVIVMAYFCEGEMECKNQILMDADAFQELLKNDKPVLCAECYPKFKDCTMTEMQENESLR